MYRVTVVALLVLACSVALAGCHSGTTERVAPAEDNEDVIHGIANVIVHSDYSQAVSRTEVLSELKGRVVRGIGFIRPEDRDVHPFDRPQTEEFRLKEGETFAPYLGLLNGTQKLKTFLVTAILDYRQVRFELDGKDGLLHEVTVPPETDMVLPFCLSVDGPGAHDIQIVGFEDPYNWTLDEDFRMNLYGHAIARRAVIILGEDETPVRFLQPTIVGVPAVPDATFTPYICFASAATREGAHPSERQLYVDEALAGDSYRFQILLNNRDSETATHLLLIPFLDFHQTEIEGRDVIVADLGPAQEAIVDTEMLLPEEPGIHQFQAIWLYDPYQSVLRNEVLGPFVFGSPRIAINVR